MHRYKDKNLYSILGINPTATKSEIKSAYRNLARKYHPDVNPGNKVSENKFKEIGEAYEILTHDAKRKQYDILNGYNSPSYNKNNNQKKSQAKQAYKNTKETKDSTKQRTSKKKTQSNDKPFNSVFSEFLDGVFKTVDEPKQTKTHKPLPKQGTDINVDVSITADEAKNGSVRMVNVLHTDPCKKCLGKRFINGSKCLSCHGNGEVTTLKKINVKIPTNVKEGSKIRIANEGNQGLNGGKSGDLYLIVHILRSDIFTFDDLNVFAVMPITPWEAALGADIEVPTVDGFVTMKIPPVTGSGQKFKLSGQGLSDSKSKKKGDYVVTTKIELPKNLSNEEIKLYKELSKISTYNPRKSIINER